MSLSEVASWARWHVFVDFVTLLWTYAVLSNMAIRRLPRGPYVFSLVISCLLWRKAVEPNVTIRRLFMAAYVISVILSSEMWSRM